MLRIQTDRIFGSDNPFAAVEAAKRRYERLCRVPIWSLYADRLELESKGQRISFRPTHDEIALTGIPGRDREVEWPSQARAARRGLHC
jgi:hypothetical protein